MAETIIDRRKRARATFILQTLVEEGQINWGRVIARFDMSRAAVHLTFKWFQDAFPGAMVYDKSLKAFLIGPRAEEHARAHGLGDIVDRVNGEIDASLA